MRERVIKRGRYWGKKRVNERGGGRDWRRQKRRRTRKVGEEVSGVCEREGEGRERLSERGV